MAQARVVQHETVEVGVVGVEHVRVVQRVEVIHIRRDLDFVRDAVLDDGAKGVGGVAFGEREFRVPVGHGFWTDED